MVEKLEIRSSDKKGMYEELVEVVRSITDGETDMISNMANTAAVIKEAFGHLWVGFYIVRRNGVSGADELVLGPFQGPLACSRIAYGKGVCGTAWKDAATVVVPDVDLFPGHIACSSLSRSEIVVPLHDGGEVFAVLDIDSVDTETFDDTDRIFLEKMVSFICKE